jgi:hypothetical protein
VIHVTNIGHWPVTGSSYAALDHTLTKEFLRWYSYSARGLKAKNGLLVIKSVLYCAEIIPSGFEESMQINIMIEDRKEVFNVRRAKLLSDPHDRNRMLPHKHHSLG